MFHILAILLIVILIWYYLKFIWRFLGFGHSRELIYAIVMIPIWVVWRTGYELNRLILKPIKRATIKKVWEKYIMSFNGFMIFEKNLRKVMDSKPFKEGNTIDKLKIGYTLLNSQYGNNWFGAPKELNRRPK